MPYTIKRALEQTFLTIQSEYPVTLLTGPRQVGKTTLLKSLMEGTNRTYVTLDDFNARSLAKDPAAFFQIHKPPILIDEVQYAPNLFSYIKSIVDSSHQKGDFWLTGSQAYKLMQGVTESLAGRIAIISMQTLSQAEIFGLDNQSFDLNLERLRQRRHNGLTIPSVYEAIFKGGMPELSIGAISDVKGYYSNYVRSYIERDVKYMSSEIDGLKYYDFIRSIAARVSQQINIADIGRDIGVNEITLKRWLKILESLGIIFFLHPYSNNVLKRALKKPKLYFFDTALAVHLIGWDSAKTIMDCAMNGAYFENFVISEIYKSYLNNGIEPKLYYYRDKEGQEIDLILEQNATLHPIEIKKNALVNKDMTKAFTILKPAHPFTVGNGAIICNSNSLSAINNKTLIIPIGLV